MRYLHFYTTMLLVFGATCLCWLGLVTLLPCAPSESLVWWHDTYARKIAYANRTPGRRILFAAGSSGAYSLSAAEITRRSGVPAVNMALYAGLGLRVILRQTMKVARRGDLVVLPLEYEQYQGSLEEASDSIGYKLAWEPLTLLQGHGLGAVNAVLAMPVERVYNRLLWQVVPQRMGPGHQIGIQINTAGDIVTNWPHHRDASAFERLKDPLPSTYLQHGTAVAPTAATALTEFVAWCRARGVTVVATYPGIMDSPVYHQPGRCKILSVLRTFYAGLGVPMLGDPQAFMLDKSMFFDSIYHLAHDGQLAHTARVARLLDPYMKAMLPANKRLASHAGGAVHPGEKRR
jgi:hypothetical protein